MTLLWVVPLGLLVGIALGSLGGGGSILTVPALVYLLGLSPKEATTGSLIIVGLTSLIGAIPHYRRGNVRLARGVAFGVLGAAGSYVGARAAAGVPSSVLLSAFSGLMLVVAYLMWRRLQRPRAASGTDVEHAPHPLLVVAAATGVGLLTGFFGVGGGFAVVPALVLALGLPMPAAIGTSLIVIAINSATALASRLGSGVALDWVVILGFSAFAIAGSLLGARVHQRLSHRALTQAFIVMLLAVALYMAASNVPALLR